MKRAVLHQRGARQAQSMTADMPDSYLPSLAELAFWIEPLSWRKGPVMPPFEASLAASAYRE